MATDGEYTSRPRAYALIALDTLAYAAVVAAGTLVLSVVVGVVTGGGLVRAKLLLFLAGWVLLALATVRLWPRSPTEAATSGGVRRSVTAETTRIETVADVLPPVRWLEPPPRKFSPPIKLFVGSVLVLLVSFLLEVVFAVE